ncbi:MAG: hypothetical protein WAM00_11590 [Salegentibacter sp.]
MKIVELCGSPGVGKSTIFGQIDRRERQEFSWTTASNKLPMGNESRLEFLRKVLNEILNGKKPVNPRSQKMESWFEYARRIYRGIKLGRNFVDLYILKEAGDRFVAQYPQYVDACWENLFYRQARSSNGLDLRFEKAEFIYLIIKKFQVLKEKKSNKTVIIDEGLINMIDRALYKSKNPLEEKEEIEEVLETMPWPDALVYLDSDLEENARRIIERKDIRDMHKGLSLDELMDFTRAGRERILTAIRYLEEKGIPVLYLDTLRPVSENADKIIEFAADLKSAEFSVPSKEPLSV